MNDFTARTPLLRRGRIPNDAAVMGMAPIPGDARLVVADWRGAVWTWNPVTDAWRRHVLADAFALDPEATGDPDANRLDTVATAVADGTVLLAAGGSQQPPALWELDGGGLLHDTTYDEPYTSAVCAVAGPGPARFLTAPQELPDLRLWTATADGAVTEQLWADDYLEAAGLATAHIGGRTLLALCGGAELEVWDLDRIERLARLFADDSDRAVAMTHHADRPLVVAAGGGVRVWGLPAAEDAEPEHTLLDGHTDEILALGVTTVATRPVAVTGGSDGRVCVWDVAAGELVATPPRADTRPVESVVTTTLDGRPVAVAAGRGGTVEVWDLGSLWL